MSILGSFVRSAFSYTKFNFVLYIDYLNNLTRLTALENWIALQESLDGCDLLSEEKEFLDFCQRHLTETRSQLLQDLFVLWVTELQSNGYFVEFGAADGITHSNTYLLEKKYGWHGLLIEPLPSAFRTLKRNRENSKCVRAAVDPLFSMKTTIAKLRAIDQISALDGYLGEDYHSERRLDAPTINVQLINLHDLLSKSEFDTISYISIDTEGSEAAVVSRFNWLTFSPKVVTIETNGRMEDEVIIMDKMQNAGYTLFSRRISRWDMWFIRK